MLKVGDKVMIQKDSEFYLGHTNNPIDTTGVVVPSKITGWYRVKWSNGEHNSYKLKDLVLKSKSSTRIVTLKSYDKPMKSTMNEPNLCTCSSRDLFNYGCKCGGV